MHLQTSLVTWQEIVRKQYTSIVSGKTRNSLILPLPAGFARSAGTKIALHLHVRQCGVLVCRPQLLCELKLHHYVAMPNYNCVIATKLKCWVNIM